MTVDPSVVPARPDSKQGAIGPRVVFAAILFLLGPRFPALAAAPDATSATIHVTDRYEVVLGDGTTEYRIPIDLLAFASDADGDVLAFTAGDPEPVGDLVDHGDGLVVYRVDAVELSAAESASFDFTVSDTVGGTATATVTIRDPQVIFDEVQGVVDFFEIPTDVPSILPVLANDENADRVASFTTGDFGEVTLNDDETALVFTPGEGFGPGVTDTFEYVPAGPGGEGEMTLVTVLGEEESAPPAPLRVFQHWDFAEVTDGANVVFPNHVSVGTSKSIRMDLYNSTGEVLEITNHATAISGECFSQVEDPNERVPPTVEPGDVPPPELPEEELAPGFRVRVVCSTAGTKTATVTLETRSASGVVYEPFMFTVTAEVVDGPRPPTPLVVKQHWDGAIIPNGAVIDYPNQAIFDFPTSFAVDLENPTPETIEILNAEDAISGWAYEPVLPEAPVPDSIAADVTALFRVRLHVSEPGVSGETVIEARGTVTLETASASGELYEPFSFSVDATVVIPEIGVFRGWPGADPAAIPGGIEDDEIVELPTVAAAGDTSHSVAFQIRNTGSAGTLAITNPDATLVDGECFVVKTGGFPEDLLAAGEATAFRVWWGGSCGPGTYTATVNVVSNAWTDFHNPFLAWNRVRFTIVGRVAAVPDLTCEPEDLRVVAGGTASFDACVANDDASFTYNWFKDGQPIAGSGPTLSLPGVTDADEGSYHVEVVGELGPVASRAATLTVVGKPVVSQPANQTVASGGTATFSVVVSSPDEDGPFGYFWQVLPPGASSFQTITGANTDTLTVSGVTLAMDGTKYRCLVGNDAGQTSSEAATLTVVQAPAITRHPEPQRAVAGSNVTFAVTATGSGPFTYLWTKDGASLGVTDPELALAAVTDADEGDYRVRVSNSEGSATSQAAGLTVVNRPVVSRPANQSVPVGGTATYSVTVSSPPEDGPFIYRWQHLPPGASTFQTIAGATGASLTVSDVTPSMDGTRYRCLVRNEAGWTNSRGAGLTVQTPDVGVTRDWDGVAAGEGSTIDFGSVDVGVTASRRFRITNTGDATLTISNPTSFVGGACWSQIENAASSVAPGATTYFRVRLHCSSSGTKSGTITIQSNDPSSPYVFSVRGTVTVPDPGDVTVYRAWNGVVQPEGQIFPFPDTPVGASVSRRFRITNTGSGMLTISNPTSFVSGTCWSQIENAQSTVPPGASTYFRVRLLCNSAGTKSGTIRIYSNDTSSPYVFSVRGAVTAPEPGDVTVYRDWNSVVQPEGQTFPFPDTGLGTSVSRRFRITNTGSGTLTISNPTSLVSGTCWSQIENAAATVAPGASTYFRVRLFCSSATGTKTGTITIYSNDTSSPYRFYVRGTVTD